VKNDGLVGETIIIIHHHRDFNIIFVEVRHYQIMIIFDENGI
jgi:hypothetical protein